MEIIYILGASQAFFLSFLAFKKKNKTTGDYILAIWLGFIGLHLLDYYFLSTGISFKYPHLLGIGASFPLLQGPFMFIYVSVMISEKGKFKAVYCLHGLPFLLLSLYFIFDFYFLSATEKLAYIKLQESEPNFSIILLNILIVLLGPIYVLLSLIKLHKHKQKISENFSYTEKINLNWLRYIMIGLGFIWFTVLSSNILVKIPLITDKVSEKIIYLSVTLAVFFLGYFGIKQQTIYSASSSLSSIKMKSKKTKNKKDKQYMTSNLNVEQEEKIIKELTTYFKNEKPYLEGELTLNEIAEALNIKMTLLSQLINGRIGKSFFDFVNEYRVEEFISRISDPSNKQYTLLAIAYDSGFNSKSSFNRIFKKFTGLTPSQFIERKTV